MDSIEYAMKVGKKVQESFEAGEDIPWHERVKRAGDAVMDEEDESGVKKFTLVISYYGEVGQVFTSTEEDILGRLNRWLPELRARRVKIEGHPDHRCVVSETGNRKYEIFPTIEGKALDAVEVPDV
jgi:hypothetical protein